MQSEAPLAAPPALQSLLLQKPVALFLDFDGTLVELASTPDTIAVRAGLGEALVELAAQLEGRLAIISGRSIDDIERHLGALPLAIAGSHGAAVRLADGNIIGQAPKGIGDAARASLKEFARANGLDLEEKPHGAALHYRADPSKEDASRGFAAELAEFHGLETKHGKCVVELVEQGANKGSAVRSLMHQSPFKGADPWFLGDDVTDEDGFSACQSMGGAGILIGERERTEAGFALANVSAAHNWLGF